MTTYMEYARWLETFNDYKVSSISQELIRQIEDVLDSDPELAFEYIQKLNIFMKHTESYLEKADVSLILGAMVADRGWLQLAVQLFDLAWKYSHPAWAFAKNAVGQWMKSIALRQLGFEQDGWLAFCKAHEYFVFLRKTTLQKDRIKWLDVQIEHMCSFWNVALSVQDVPEQRKPYAPQYDADVEQYQAYAFYNP